MYHYNYVHKLSPNKVYLLTFKQCCQGDHQAYWAKTYTKSQPLLMVAIFKLQCYYACEAFLL